MLRDCKQAQMISLKFSLANYFHILGGKPFYSYLNAMSNLQAKELASNTAPPPYVFSYAGLRSRFLHSEVEDILTNPWENNI